MFRLPVRRALIWIATAVALVAIGLGGTSCLAPTLPLPPPEEPSYVAANSTETEWSFTGSCQPGALVLALNGDQGELYLDADFTGTYSITITGKQCDLVEIWQQVSGEESAHTGFLLESKDPADPQPSVCN